MRLMSLQVLATIVVALAGIPTGTTALVSGYRPGSETLRLEAAAPLDSVDPAVANSSESLLLQNATCARLYTYNGLSSDPSPQIAIGLPIVGPDGNRPRQWKTYTIKMRSGYQFQDGTSVTAYSFADALDRDADPDLLSRRRRHEGHHRPRRSSRATREPSRVSRP